MAVVERLKQEFRVSNLKLSRETVADFYTPRVSIRFFLTTMFMYEKHLTEIFATSRGNSDKHKTFLLAYKVFAFYELYAVLSNV